MVVAHAVEVLYSAPPRTSMVQTTGTSVSMVTCSWIRWFEVDTAVESEVGYMSDQKGQRDGSSQLISREMLSK